MEGPDPRGSRSPACRSRPGDARTPAPTAGPGFGPARPSTHRQSRGSTPSRRPHGASGTGRSAACGIENARDRPTPPAHAHPDTACPIAPRIPPDPQRSPKTRRRNVPAECRRAFGGCGCRTGCVLCRTASARSGCPDPPKGDAGATKGTDSAAETPKTPQSRYRASHTGCCARTARPAAARPDNPQALRSAQDIPYHGLNHISKPMKAPIKSRNENR